MIISVIVAMATNRVIGSNDRIPWQGHLRSDMDYFRDTTMGHPVVMGRKTWESIPAKFRPLPGRRNVAITRQAGFLAEGAEVVHSPQEALSLLEGEDEVFFIGGSQVYEEILPCAQRLYITFVEQPFDGDVLFPEVLWSLWEKTGEKTGVVDEKSHHPHTFRVFERKEDASVS